MRDVILWWIFFFFEALKDIMLAYGVFGYNFSLKRVRFLIPVLYVAVSVCFPFNGLTGLCVRTFWGLVLVVSLFEGKLSKRIQCSVIAFFLISSIDALAINIIEVFGVSIPAGNDLAIQLADGIGLFVIAVLAAAVRGKRKEIHQGIEELGRGYFLLTAIILVGTATLAAVLLTGKDRWELNYARETFIIAAGILIVTVIILIILFFYIIYMKKRLEELNDAKERCMIYQRRYYENRMKKDEGIQRFRHDFHRHLRVLGHMCRENKPEDAARYIEEIESGLAGCKMQYTGNTVADYFLNEAAEEFRDQDITLDIRGRFPEDNKLSDSDLCVLWGNAIDNAREELFRCEGGKRELRIRIRSGSGNLELTIANTCHEKNERMRTRKEDKELHGYGIGNMMQVVIKYRGSMTWEYKEELFVLKIVL